MNRDSFILAVLLDSLSNGEADGQGRQSEKLGALLQGVRIGPELVFGNKDAQTDAAVRVDVGAEQIRNSEIHRRPIRQALRDRRVRDAVRLPVQGIVAIVMRVFEVEFSAVRTG